MIPGLPVSGLNCSRLSSTAQEFCSCDVVRTCGLRPWSAASSGWGEALSPLIEQPLFSFLGQRRLRNPGARGGLVEVHPVARDVFHLIVAHLLVGDGGCPLRREFGVLPGQVADE